MKRIVQRIALLFGLVLCLGQSDCYTGSYVGYGYGYGGYGYGYGQGYYDSAFYGGGPMGPAYGGGFYGRP
ncbi:MAG: hypothetical protein WBM48_18005 [Polyangiales bacterium]